MFIFYVNFYKLQVSTCLVYHVNIQKKYGITNEYWKILAQGKQEKVEKFTIFVIIANVNLKYVQQDLLGH